MGLLEQELKMELRGRVFPRYKTMLVMCLGLACVVGLSDGKEDGVCRSDTGTGKDAQRRRIPGNLRPEDLPSPAIFSEFNETLIVSLPGKEDQTVKVGSISQINRVDSAAAAGIAVLPNLMEQQNVEQIVRLLRAYKNYDADPDTVDGLPTYEMFVDSPDLGEGPSMKVLDSDPRALPERNQLRRNLRAILHPILQERITPFVEQHYPHVCNKTEDRSCTPCYSLIRRYRHRERQSHDTHRDGHAVVTVVVSLSNYGSDYEGGLYVSTGYGQRKFVALSAGDAVSHQSTLLHGVKVLDLPENPEKTERWSWILWYRDSASCDDNSHEWFQACSDAGDAVCQELHSTKVGNVPGISNEEAAKQVLELNRAAAEKGSGNAAVKMARAYLKQLPAAVPYNETEASRFFQIAIDSHHPDGHYGMAILLSTDVQKAEAAGRLSSAKGKKWGQGKIVRAVWHLEEAALLGHAFATFNLGIAHVFGYGMPDNRIDVNLAAAWLVRSGLPEGYFVAAHQANAAGDIKRRDSYNDMAKTLGQYQPWRKEARQRTGSGGAGGVDLNLPWPSAHDGRRPPMF